MEKKIKILPGGPYKVEGDIPLKNAVIVSDEEGHSESWREGTEYPTEAGKPYFLCRCGHSKNKPFCDGSHQAKGFTGKESCDKTPYVESCRVYEGARYNLLDHPKLCCRVRFCHRGIGAWDAAIESYTPEKRQLAREETFDCASGRLTLLDKQTGQLVEPELPTEICPVQDPEENFRGPLWVKGGIPLEGADGEMYETRNRVTLCRCGQSKNMPYCDISHMTCPHMKGTDE